MCVLPRTQLHNHATDRILSQAYILKIDRTRRQ